MSKNQGGGQKIKWKALVAYDGTDYAGFQKQPNAPTIQGELEAILMRMHRDEIQVIGSGRTDAGVHAKGQVIHFESDLQLKPAEWQRALNAQLPEAIRILSVEQAAPDFHARYSACGKEYRYFIDRSAVRNPFLRRYSMHMPYPLDVKRMGEAAQLLKGTHDFSAFSSARTAVKNKIRTIEKLTVHTRGKVMVIRCLGDGFLYNMVRIIVGTLLEVGQGRKSLVDIEQALKEGDRTLTGPTAPAEGLFLWKVFYP